MLHSGVGRDRFLDTLAPRCRSNAANLARKLDPLLRGLSLFALPKQQPIVRVFEPLRALSASCFGSRAGTDESCGSPGPDTNLRKRVTAVTLGSR